MEDIPPLALAAWREVPHRTQLVWNELAEVVEPHRPPFDHKLCALLDRTEITSRDVLDCWFFLKERTSINKGIVESRMGMPMEEYLDKCIASVQDISEKSLISGLGEFTEGEMKNFVRHGLKDELISLLTMFKAFPSFA